MNAIKINIKECKSLVQQRVELAITEFEGYGLDESL